MKKEEFESVKKRIALLLNFILLAGCLLFLFYHPALSGPISYVVGTEGKLAKIENTCRQAEEPFFTELAFSGEKLAFDKNTSAFYLPLNMEEEAWETGTLTSLAPDVELLFAEDFTKLDKQEVIREGRAFRFLAVRGTEYQECFLIVTGLPIIAIETEENADTEVFGGMAYFWDNETKRDWTSSSILEAHIRGNTSRTYPKKGYKLTLKTQNKEGEIVADKKSLFGLRKDDEWILNAMYSDSSKIRDKVSTEVWKELGASNSQYPDAKFSTDFTYVEVFFNQEYWGLYGLMEPVDSKQLDLTKEAENGQTEYAYKSITPQSVSSELLEQEVLETENLAGYELKGTYSTIGLNTWEPLISFLKVRDTQEDALFAEQIGEKADINSALKVWVYLQAVLGIDNRAKNMYYVAKNTGDSQKIYFVPWDMDITWGDALSEGTDGNIWDVGVLSNLYSERINWGLGDRLIQLDVDDSREQAAEIWKDLREGILSPERLTEVIEDAAHQVQDSGAYARNAEKWPESNSGADYDQFTRMALYRMGFLDYYFDGNLDAYMGLGYQ